MRLYRKTNTCFSITEGLARLGYQAHWRGGHQAMRTCAGAGLMMTWCGRFPGMSGPAMCAIRGCGSPTSLSRMLQCSSKPWMSSWTTSAPFQGMTALPQQ